MLRHVFLGGAVCLLVASVHAQTPASEDPGVHQPKAASDEPSALLQRYCIGCHNEKLKSADLSFAGLDVNNARRNAPIWERVVLKVRAGAMPPVGRPRPSKAGYEAFIRHLEGDLDRGFAEDPNPGRPAMFHRLNRAEYKNAIRDLLGLSIETRDLPDDAQSYGFDNIGDILGVTPVTLERYLSSARRISRLALGASTIAPTSDAYVVPSDLTQRDRLDGLPLGTRGGTVVRTNAPLDGNYDVKIALARDNDANLLGVKEAHQVEISVDDERVKTFTVGGIGGEAEMSFRIPLKAGPRAIGIAFLKRPSVQFEDVRQPLLRSVVEHGLTDGLPYIGKVTVSGPFDAQGAGDTPWRRAIFVCRPVRAEEEASCARKIVSSFARRAYRRPVTGDDMLVLMRFYEEGRKAAGFERGIEQALLRILVSPSFLFRISKDPAGIASGATYKIGDIELASRLSFFCGAAFQITNCLTSQNVISYRTLRFSISKCKECWPMRSRAP